MQFYYTNTTYYDANGPTVPSTMTCQNGNVVYADNVVRVDRVEKKVDVTPARINWGDGRLGWFNRPVFRSAAQPRIRIQCSPRRSPAPALRAQRGIGVKNWRRN